VDSGVVTLYWQSRRRIRSAEYGAEIVAALRRQLEAEFGRGFSEKTLRHMARFVEVVPDKQIVSAPRRQLGWTDFSPDLVFRDPYVLDFLRLRDTYAEKDVEAAILREIESFILELGVGFAFLERQKRMQIGSKDYYLDLLFYHRKLRRLVAIDLKMGEFEAADKGQMELYLNWLKRHECEPGEGEPLGMILCAGKNEEHVELLELEKSGIHVATFWTKVLPKAQLQRKLHEAVRLARARLAERAQAKPTAKGTKRRNSANSKSVA